MNVSVQHEQKHLNSEKSISLLPTEQRLPNEKNSSKEIESVKSSVSWDNSGKPEPYAQKSLQVADGQQSMIPRHFGTSFGQPPLSFGNDTNKLAGFGPVLPVSDKLKKDMSEQSKSMHMQTSFGSKSTPSLFGTGLQNAFVPSLQNTQAQPWSSGKGISRPDFVSSPFPSVKDTQHKESEQTGTGYVNSPMSIKEKPVQVIETASASALSNKTPLLVQNQDDDDGVEKIEPIPSIHASQLSLQVKSSFEKSFSHQQHKTPLNAGPRLEHNMSKQPSNVMFTHNTYFCKILFMWNKYYDYYRKGCSKLSCFHFRALF